MNINIAQINPFIRDAEIQNAIIEGEKERFAYDHRLFYVLENDGYIIIEGKTYRISPDTLILIPPVTGYRFCGKMKVAILNFDMTRNADTREKAICPPVRELFSPLLIFDSVVCDELDTPLIAPLSDFLKNNLLELIYVWNEKTPLSDADTSARLKSILISVLERNSQKPDQKTLLCSKIQGYIKLNAQKQINAASLAKHFGYHSAYLGEIFKECTGLSIYKAIVLERIHLAKRWLTETDSPIDEIAFEVGFSSRPHFCTAFKAHTGLTPLHYRKRFEAGKAVTRL